jgi:hypothetical protein
MTGKAALLAGILCAVAACVPADTPRIGDSAPPPAATAVLQDVDFMRGCWIARDSYGFATAMLRLLPPNGPNSPTLEGYLQSLSRSEVVRAERYVVARNGHSLAGDENRPDKTDNGVWSASRPPANAPQILSPGAKRVAYSRMTDRPKRIAGALKPLTKPVREWLFAEGEGERLAITYMDEVGFVYGIFDGRRDGCD